MDVFGHGFELSLPHLADQVIEHVGGLVHPPLDALDDLAQWHREHPAARLAPRRDAVFETGRTRRVALELEQRSRERVAMDRQVTHRVKRRTARTADRQPLERDVARVSFEPTHDHARVHLVRSSAIPPTTTDTKLHRTRVA